MCEIRAIAYKLFTLCSKKAALGTTGGS